MKEPNTANPLSRIAERALGGVRWRVRRAKEKIRASPHPVAQFLTDPQYRWKLWARTFNPPDVHQVAARTRLDRYPEIFAACRDHFGENASVKLLSFGCSTGEEVITLRRYLPAATIVGSEINARSLAACRQLTVDDRITFVRSDAANISAHAPYDAIFCMAVLQRDPQLVVRENITSLRKTYPFEKFDRQVAELDRWVKPGGILILHHTHYLLADSSVGARYTLLPSAAHLKEGYAKFDRNGARIGLEVPSHSIFLKAG